MIPKDDSSLKKTSPARGRIMQVVEVEEDTAPKHNVDVPVPSDIIKEEHPVQEQEEVPQSPEHTKENESEVKPDIAASFPVPGSQTSGNRQMEEESAAEIPPLKPEEKRDLVSELFEQNKTAVQYPNISIDKKSSSVGLIVWIVVLLAVVAIIGGGLFFVKQKSTAKQSAREPSVIISQTPEPTVIETPEASLSGTRKPTPSTSASPSATPVKAGLSVQILNGSGEKGVASTAKKLLEEKGYAVSGTGNAENFDYQKTEIIIKADKAGLLEKLKADLSGTYTIGSTSANLDPKVSYDAQVIIGKE